ncbi:hypothetical protein [Gloeothece verrucosa]|uniref:Signal protein n=1 Tax=Gloeothece verrucosa (strain PCC 7822) TaxID=497965 RepID=E0UN97_GLOV7|nr:hypothetical protein [Gloeothece verrucosa]ADN18427.1 signal protein [Gloeothece verrucosa PCC 7822]
MDKLTRQQKIAQLKAERHQEARMAIKDCLQQKSVFDQLLLRADIYSRYWLTKAEFKRLVAEISWELALEKSDKV